MDYVVYALKWTTRRRLKLALIFFSYPKEKWPHKSESLKILLAYDWLWFELLFVVITDREVVALFFVLVVLWSKQLFNEGVCNYHSGWDCDLTKIAHKKLKIIAPLCVKNGPTSHTAALLQTCLLPLSLGWWLMSHLGTRFFFSSFLSLWKTEYTFVRRYRMTNPFDCK